MVDGQNNGEEQSKEAVDEDVAVVGGDKKPPEFGDFVRGLLINQNPFYLISAALVLYGLSAGFGTDDVWINTTIPLTVMLTYAVVLSGIAVTLIRRGKVWEDVRSILLALGILFFNVSAALDELLVRETEGAMLSVLAVWLMVPILVEFLRRGIGIRWPVSFVAPIYLILGLVLTYPALSAHFLLAKKTTHTAWSIAAFPVLAGLALLTLLPAVRRFARGNWDNGTPWRRLQLVVIIALPLALLARTYLLATAFYPFPGMAVGGYHQLDTAFGGWCCVPIVLACLALLLEVGIVQNRALWRRIALFAAPFVIPLAMIGPDGSHAYHDMRELLTMNLASPVMVAAVAAALFAVVACLRRVPEAFSALMLTVLMLSPVGVETVNLNTIQPPSWVPMTLAAIGCFAALVRNRHSAYFIAGWLAATAAMANLADGLEGLRLTAVVTHVIVIGIILAALNFRDTFAKIIARALSGILPVMLIPAFWFSPESFPEPGILGRLAYGAAVIGLCRLLQRQVHHDWFRLANYANFVHTAIFALSALGGFLDQLEVRGSGRIVAGAATLAVAVWISWLKTQRQRHEESGSVTG